MTAVTEPRADALAPLREALLARARAEGDRIRAAAAAEGARLEASAAEEADRLLATARSQGEADAAALLAVDRAWTRHSARAILLTAQRGAYDELREQARAALRAALDDPSRRTQLAAALRRRLGSGVVVTEHPDGGLVADAADNRRADGSVGALIDAALTALDVDDLWAAP